MLEIGTIWPSHSPWASPVVLVCKKDVKLWFHIDLRKLNAHMIKDSYSLPWIGQFEWVSLVDSTGPQIRLLANGDGWGIQAINSIHCRPTGILWMWMYAFWTGEFPGYVPESNGDMFGWPSAQLVPHLSSWHDSIFKNAKKALDLVESSLLEAERSRTKIKTQWVFQEIFDLLGT